MTVAGMLTRSLLFAMCLSFAYARAQNYTSSLGSSTLMGENSDVIAVVQQTSFSNNYDGVLSFSCPKGYAIYYVHSVHSNHYEDRKWTFKCRKQVHMGFPVECDDELTDPKWGWDKKLHFQCPWNTYIGGIYSRHDNYFEDREWKYTCCSAPCHSYDLSRYYTAKNNLDATFTREATSVEDVFRGMYSEPPSNYHEDRVFFFEVRPYYYDPGCNSLDI